MEEVGFHSFEDGEWDYSLNPTEEKFVPSSVIKFHQGTDEETEKLEGSCEHAFQTFTCPCDNKEEIRICVKCCSHDCSQDANTGEMGELVEKNGSLLALEPKTTKLTKNKFLGSKPSTSSAGKSGHYEERSEAGSERNKLALKFSEMIESLSDDNSSEPELQVVDLTRPDSIGDYIASYFKGTDMESGMSLSARWPVDIPFKVKVIGVLPPGCLLIQSVEQMNKVKNMSLEIEKSSVYPLRRNEVFSGNYVAVVLDRQFYRAQIEEVSITLGKCRVRLLDCCRIDIVYFHQIYELPTEMQTVCRQVGLIITDSVKPSSTSNGEVCAKQIETLLVGKNITATITHELICMSGIYYGSLVTEDGVPLPNLLLERGFIKSSGIDENEYKCLSTNPKFPICKLPTMRANEISQVTIAHIFSPDKFYVVKREPQNVSKQKTIHKLANNWRTFGSPEMFICGNSDGSKMCLISLPEDSKSYCRAVCISIDYTQCPTQATVLYADYGWVRAAPLEDLLVYSEWFVTIDPLVYECGLAAKPAGKDWSEFLRKCLETMAFRSIQSVEAHCLCVDGNLNLIDLKCHDGLKTWLSYMEEIGHAIQDVGYINRFDSVKAFDRLNDSSLDFLKFLEPEINLDILPEKIRQSLIYYGHIPPARAISEMDKLKTRRLVGSHIYLVMCEWSYHTYKDLRLHCKRVYEDTAINCEKPDFQVGEVVIAPWTPGNYQRACVTQIMELCGSKYASLYFFDIEKTGRVDMKILKPADAYCMTTEKLSHKVWLTGCSHNTLVSSQAFEKVMASLNDWTILTRIKTVGSNPVRYSVLLAVTDISGLLTSLSDLIRYMEVWTWERLYDMGAPSLQEMISGTSDNAPCKFNLEQFMVQGKPYFNELGNGITPFIIKTVEFNLKVKKVYLSGILLGPSESAQMDYRAVAQQMLRYNEKCRGPVSSVSTDSTTFPDVVMVLTTATYGTQEIEKVLVSSSQCPCHRCIYRESVQGYECVDCFKVVKGEKGTSLGALDIKHTVTFKEICPEMLKVPPVGMRLVVELPPKIPEALMVPIVKEMLAPGMIIQVVLLKMSKEPLWVWEKSEKAMKWIPVNIPALSNGIYNMVQNKKKQMSMQKDGPISSK